VYKALGDMGNPTLSTLLALTKALGVRLSIAA
jgi:DNA-binding phage protein